MIIKELEKPPTWVRMNALGGGDDVDPITSAELKLENATKPELEEPALVHPFNTSTVKIRNNGMIDVFVGTDQGIRLDPYSKTINEIVDGLKWHVGYFKGWIEQDAKWYAKQGFLFDSKGSSFTVNAKKDIVFKCEGDFIIDCKGDIKITGNGPGLSIQDGKLNFTGAGTQQGNGAGQITSASSTVLVDGVGVARLGDTVSTAE